MTKIQTVVQRFLVPNFVITLYHLLQSRTQISLKAEVEFTSNLKFGKNCVVSSFTKIKATDGPLIIGARSGFATGCFVAAHQGGIEIGENFICGPNVCIVGNNYVTEKLDVHLEDQGVTSRGIKIGKNVWIGANCTILDGSVIGDNTIVVANSLVNRRYPPNSILQGTPAKVIFKRD